MSDLSLNNEPPSPQNPNRAARKKPEFSPPAVTDPCSECGRRFWSQKALFGHMRCHPDRQWRGINPPAHLRRLQLSLSQPSTSSSSSSSSTFKKKALKRDREEDHEVAAFLVMMSKGKARKEEDRECSTSSFPLGFQRFSVVQVGNSSSSSRGEVPDLNLPPPCEDDY